MPPTNQAGTAAGRSARSKSCFYFHHDKKPSWSQEGFLFDLRKSFPEHFIAGIVQAPAVSE
jgi:hypothetical protein